MRDQGYLWIALPEGIHNVKIEGLVPHNEWEWAFFLKPQRMVVNAPGWLVSGISPDGIPDQQIIFAPLEKRKSQTSTYDRQDFPSPIQVTRELEIGLDWQVRTTVRRLSSTDRAITVRIPLLPGERLLSSQLPVNNNNVEVRLPAGVMESGWKGELPISKKLNLSSNTENSWVEQWRLTASPVWKVEHAGLAPVYENGATQNELIPVWSPWPGEKVQLSFVRPEPIQGETMTVHKVDQRIELGSRQTSSQLALSLTSSLGGDFTMVLPPASEITSLILNGQEIPARVENGKLIVPIAVGEQDLQVRWKNSGLLELKYAVPAVTLPFEASNVSIQVQVPSNRWLWWASQAEMGPAIRFWTILAFALLAGTILSRLPPSPLPLTGWILLAVGLTQTAPPAAAIVVAWLFALSFRQAGYAQDLPPRSFNALQVCLLILTPLSLVALIGVVAEGLLGSPEMFVAGNNSSRTALNWYFSQTGTELPSPWILAVSIWWYRLAMLVWALWLALSLLKWLVSGWKAFWSNGKLFKVKTSDNNNAPPPLTAE